MGEYATVTVQVIVRFQEAEELLNRMEEVAAADGVHVLQAVSFPATEREWANLTDEELE